jgi:tetratricopeptide (TPR) repeat protein
MSALDQALRLWRCLLAILLLTWPLFAQPQTPSTAAAPTPEQLRAVIERVRAVKPPDAGRITEAQLVGFELLRAARYEDALAVFRAILDAVPANAAALYGGALASFNLRRIGEAEQMARAAIKAPATVATSQGNPAAENSVGLNRNWRVEALTLLGVILAVKGDNTGALGALTEAVEVAPANFDAQLALGRARYGAGDPSGAARAFRAAVELRPDDESARFFLATALEGAGDNDGALLAYRELLSRRSDSAEGHLGLGVLLTKLGGERTAEGIRELMRAIALNGDLYEARITLGRTLVRAGQAQDAITHLERAAALAPNNPEPHYQLALAYRRLGKAELAERENAIVKEIHAARRGRGDASSPGVSSQEEPERRP